MLWRWALRLKRSFDLGKVRGDRMTNHPRITMLVLAASLAWLLSMPQESVAVPVEQWQRLELAIRDLADTFQDRYPDGPDYLVELQTLRQSHDALEAAVPRDEKALTDVAGQFVQLRSRALLANPLLAFDKLLFIERNAAAMGLPNNWESNSSLPTAGFDNRLCSLAPVRPDGKVGVVYEPAGQRFVGDLALHWNADHLLCSMPGNNGRWQVFEMGVDGKDPHELKLISEPDVDNYNACYLPDGRIMFTSTATFVGVPCVYGGSHVTNMYIRERDGSIRQTTVDQEHNWCPTVLNDGRLLYLRWEYTDLPHAHSRRLFAMNPDGTQQMSYTGSNSYFPNSFFYAKPIPGHPSKVVGIASGHHGTARSGRLLIIDPQQGQYEAESVVQEIPGNGKKVEAMLRDRMVDGVWPLFLHPYPLSEKYFLVSMKPREQANWGIYLVDIFDNMVLLLEKPGYALLEPVPVRQSPVPPAIPDRIDRSRQDAVVYLANVYEGPGLQGIPRGTVKKLRVFTYEFSFRGMGGLLGAVGMDGPWDIRRVLGTVPVEPDGSAHFRLPAYTPVSVQPLDEEGKALQLMRSWFTAMPGETVSCVGCHDRQDKVAASRQNLAALRPPSEITPWYGPTRGFNFAREVQPVLDRHCVGCHNGTADSKNAMDLRGGRIIADWSSHFDAPVNSSVGGKFSTAYGELHRFVRRPGIESDMHLLSPMEFHADGTELGQTLAKGHHGVKLDAESLDRLVTWIDLNAPYHGTWSEIVGPENVKPMAERARAMRKQYTGMEDDLEAIAAQPQQAIQPLVPEEGATAAAVEVRADAWPFDAAEAKRRQGSSEPSPMSIDLGSGVTLEFVPIPAGEFVMGGSAGHPDESPCCRVAVNKPYWIGRFEITNEQFARFDPLHNSRVEQMHSYEFGIQGYPVNGPKQPVVRVSWQRAVAFCQWLSAQTGRRVALPTEAQWEYACRAGTETSFSYGDLNTDFAPFANLGDKHLRDFVQETYEGLHPIPNPTRFDDWVPKDDRFDDGAFVSATIGKYQPNAWGLHDMHGNVSEWTRSLHRAYPYDEEDGRNDLAAEGRRVVRGGSWYDRPYRGTSSFRAVYQAWQGVFNVGFRVVVE
jgi:formylglycine-generating enzyme required for sulfatase activity